MIRREFLNGLSGLALIAMPRIPFASEPRLRVGVVGGGIVGASIAFHLARAGAAVTLFEKTGPAKGATEKSFAWINAFSEVTHYRDLRIRSIAAYHELDMPLQLNVSWGGSLWWAREPNDVAIVRATAGQLEQTAHPVRMLGAQDVATLSPNFKPGPVEIAAFCDLDGHVDPEWVTIRFLDHARKAGARIVYPCEVTNLEFKGSRLLGVATTRRRYSLDRLVVAGGIDSPHLASLVDCRLPMQHAPGILAHSTPMRHLSKTMHKTPNFLSFKQTTDGRIVAADSELPPDTPVHREIREKIVDYPADEIRTMHGKRILDKVAAVFPASAEATFDRLTLGFRPVPEDGLPVLGFVSGAPDVYIAVMHSGVTLAPIVGRYVTQEILDESLVESLAPYRPGRFAAQPMGRDAGKHRSRAAARAALA